MLNNGLVLEDTYLFLSEEMLPLQTESWEGSLAIDQIHLASKLQSHRDNKTVSRLSVITKRIEKTELVILELQIITLGEKMNLDKKK